MPGHEVISLGMFYSSMSLHSVIYLRYEFSLYTYGHYKLYIKKLLVRMWIVLNSIMIKSGGGAYMIVMLSLHFCSLLEN